MEDCPEQFIDVLANPVVRDLLRWVLAQMDKESWSVMNFQGEGRMRDLIFRTADLHEIVEQLLRERK